MNTRQLLKKNIGVQSLAAAIVVIVILVTAVSTDPSSSSAMSRVNQFDYYDALSVQSSVIQSDQKVTIHSSESSTVRAYIYACGDCSDASKQFIAYVETLTPKAMATWDEYKDIAYMPTDIAQLIESGTIVGKPGTDQWVSAYTDEARQFIENATADKCPDGGADAIACFPK